jgi:hypothetical protein
MVHPIYKFRGLRTDVVHNSEFGDEQVYEHLLAAIKIADIPQRDVRDGSTKAKVDISVVMGSEMREAIFKVACNVQPSHIIHG